MRPPGAPGGPITQLFHKDAGNQPPSNDSFTPQFRGTTTHVQVNMNDSYDTMIQKIRSKIMIKGPPINASLDRNKSVRENGLHDGSELRFHNGLMD